MTTISTLLAAGSGAASSADVEVLDAAAVRLTATGQGTVLVEPKMVSGYGPGEVFGGAGARTVMVYGPVTFRVTRQADSAAGADMEAA